MERPISRIFYVEMFNDVKFSTLLFTAMFNMLSACVTVISAPICETENLHGTGIDITIGMTLGMFLVVSGIILSYGRAMQGIVIIM